MITYRCKMPEELDVVYFKGIFKILLRMSNKKIEYRNGECTVVICSNEKINYFDLAVLFAILSIFYRYGKFQKFSELTILKMLTNNSKAHFTQNPKKRKTVTKEKIRRSLVKLSNIELIEWNNVRFEKSSFTGLIQEYGYLLFENDPLLFKIAEMGENVEVKHIDLRLFEFYKDSKTKAHTSINNISLAMFVLSKILSGEKEIIIHDMQRIIGLDEKLEDINNLYRAKRINYNIMQKRKKSLVYNFNKIYLLNYFNNLKKMKLLNNFHIENKKITICN